MRRALKQIGLVVVAGVAAPTLANGLLQAFYVWYFRTCNEALQTAFETNPAAEPELFCEYGSQTVTFGLAAVILGVILFYFGYRGLRLFNKPAPVLIAVTYLVINLVNWRLSLRLEPLPQSLDAYDLVGYINLYYRALSIAIISALLGVVYVASERASNGMLKRTTTRRRVTAVDTDEDDAVAVETAEDKKSTKKTATKTRRTTAKKSAKKPSATRKKRTTTTRRRTAGKDEA